MSNVLEELVLTLKGDASSWQSAANSGIQLLNDLDNSAGKTARRLEQVSKAFAAPGGDTAANRMAVEEAVQAHQEQLQKQALREKLARDEAESQSAWEKQEEQRAAAEERAQMERNDMVDFQSWRAQVHSNEVQQQQMLDRQLYNLTHTRYEVQRRELEIHYQRQREMHAGNARNLALVDQIYAEQRRRLEEQNDLQLQRNLLRRRGPLMMASRQILPAVGMATGGQIGMLGMMASQGLVMGGVMAATMFLAGIIKSAANHTKELKEMQKAYNEELRKSGQHWQDLVFSQVSTTSFGQTLRSKAKEESERVLTEREKWADRFKKQEDEAAAIANGRRTMLGVGFGSSGESPENVEIKKARGRIAQREQFVRLLENLAKEERRIQRERSTEERKAELDLVAVGLMHEGPARRRVEFDMALARQRRKVENDNADRLRVFEESVRIERTLKERAGASKGDMRIWEETNNKERRAIQQEGEENLADLQKAAALKTAQFLEQQKQEKLAELRSYQEAAINLTQTGYKREMALLELKQAEELANYKGHNRDLFIEQQQAIKDRMELENQKRIGEGDQSIANRLNLALGFITSTQLEEIAYEKELKELGLERVDIEQRLAALRMAQKAEANKPLLDEIEQLNIELDLQKGLITEVEAAYQRLALANKGADQELIDRLSALREQVELEKFAKEVRKTIDPEAARIKELEEYTRRLQDAVDMGLLSKQEAAVAWEKKRQSLWSAEDRRGEGREFRTMYMDPRSAAPKKTEELLQQSINEQRITNSYLGRIERGGLN